MSKYSNRKVTLSRERKFEVLRAPVVTEKATLIAENNQFCFFVSLDASKPEIKVAVEELFKVRVTNINTIVQKGKVKRFKGRPGKRSDTKKAIVTLADGDSIDVTTGL